MAAKIKIRSGTTDIELDDTATTIFTDVLQHAAPETLAVLEGTVQDIYTDAFRQWPVRKQKPLTERGRVMLMADKLQASGLSKDRAFAAAFRMEAEGEINIERGPSSRSQNSRGKLEFGIRITGDQLQAYVANSAPYAWAIKVGVDTDLPYALGARVANELLWRPAREKTDSVVDTTAKELTDILEKA
jgi:hypothetical protein